MSTLSPLFKLLDTYRQASKSEREKGTYFEQLTQGYLQNEPYYRDLYTEVLMYSDWAKKNGRDGRDVGIDLVATTNKGDVHAVQCKLYAEDYTLQKSDIDSFFTASGQKPFAHRIIVSTTNHWSVHAESALQNQQPPVSKIDLHALENSLIDWSQYQPNKKLKLKEKKTLRPHQTHAISDVLNGFKTQDRGKMIMACGTGKTFTALKIAEKMAGAGGRVLFLVPSLSLLSQALTDWTQESDLPLHSFAVCSDSDVGKKIKDDDDLVPTLEHELQYPATTDAKSLAREMAGKCDKKHMSVVFSTYHSIEVLSQAQKKHKLEPFDLVICDEAHRTTGAVFQSEEESAFVKVHNEKFLQAKKRLYMTATPRIYADSAKAKAELDGGITLCSMDDESLFGPEFHVITFSEAVKADLLVDYKVIVLAVEETAINRRLQKLLASEGNQLKVEDAARIVGCWKALAKLDLQEKLLGDTEPMKRAVAFAQVIEPNTSKSRTHKVSSKKIAGMFQEVVEAYQKQEGIEEGARLKCEAEHVDGTMNASQKEEKLRWLKAEASTNTCRILSNVRCLSEGVDVPALDAVLFLTPRSSQVDVVQSVGRVMRKAEGKNRGYVILPVVIPAGVEAHEALNDNKTYKVVWEVLQALRSHDDRFDAMVNKMDLDLNKGILSKMEVIAITDKVPTKPKNTETRKPGSGMTFASNNNIYDPHNEQQIDAKFKIGEIERAIYAKVVQKCGNRHHWEDWANDIAKIAHTHINRITIIVQNPKNKTEKEAFDKFAEELRDDLNGSITDSEVIEMLAQHLITKPVFDSLFSGYSFASHNPISLAMQQVLDVLQEHHLNKEADTLERFYDSVRGRAQGIDNAAGKQKIIIELYDKFFRNAFPKMTERLGIVYTPVEVVDFILHSVNHLLNKNFNQTLGSPGVHILDPFTGTGTFITRLLQSGLIAPEELPHKYAKEIHANEIVLLAYYIAAINIEAVYHDIVGGRIPLATAKTTQAKLASATPTAGDTPATPPSYTPFPGILLTDTFEMYEKDDLISELMVDNSERRKRQKELDIRIIIGNPPYSAGQNNANDNNANVGYPQLDERIRSTYAEKSKATNKNALYDSYIRSIRWASDRVGKSGIIGFVTNAGFVEANTADGLRKCLAEEFSSIYIFHLRGNQRTQGELSRKEGGKIFGSGSRAPIAISFLVKNPKAKQQGQIHICDIGDYLSREEKLAKIVDYYSVAGIDKAKAWQSITPDEHGDWLNQRDNSFDEFMVMGDKKNNDKKVLFETYSRGLETGRDAWCYNPSNKSVQVNMVRMIKFYNLEVKRFNAEHSHLDRKRKDAIVANFIDSNPKNISWSSSLIPKVVGEKRGIFSPDNIVHSVYRPFSKQWLYYDGMFNHRVGQMPKIFPDATTKNRVICVTGVGARSFSTLIIDTLPCLDNIEKGQCFPLYLYEEPDQSKKQEDLLQPSSGYIRRDAITAQGLAHFQKAYPKETIKREDIFYYTYGLLHSPEYCERYGDNLSKELPRIPCVKKASAFWAFSKAGRELAKLHIDYETVKPHNTIRIEVAAKAPNDTTQRYRVEKMRYGKTKHNGKTIDDKTTLEYNDNITLKNIPLDAYNYIVNGKPALDWIVERQCNKTDKDSGIQSDANAWATETIGNPKYPLELFLRLVTVSLETNRIVNALPALDV